MSEKDIIKNLPKDLLNRDEQINNLISYFKNYNKHNCKLPEEDAGLIMAITAGWGYGKTYFVKKLNEKCNKQGIVSMYFSAWESDLLQNPVAYILHEFTCEINKIKDEKMIKELRKYIDNFKKFSKGFLKGIAKEIPIATSVIDEFINNNITDEYKRVKEAVDGLKESLAFIAEKLSEFKNKNDARKYPLVVFVDEIDRCNPNYAVQFLEALKHIFNIKNIIFVLSIDKTQLENSIKHIYGCNTNTTEYLSRFIQFEYVLNPSPVKMGVEYYLKKMHESNSFLSFSDLYPNADKYLIAKLAEFYQISYRTFNLFIRNVCFISLGANCDKGSSLSLLYFFYMFDKKYFDYLTVKDKTYTEHYDNIQKFIKSISYNIEEVSPIIEALNSKGYNFSSSRLQENFTEYKKFALKEDDSKLQKYNSTYYTRKEILNIFSSININANV